ncbi:SufD family Fe-S cluster assembly protein [Mycoplasmatota bacterium WC44]
MFDLNIEKIFSHNPMSVLNYRKESVNDIETLDYPNMGKLKIEDFIKEEMNLQNVIISKSYQIPNEMNHLVNEDVSNVVIIKDGNIIYENLTDNFQDVYINDFNSAFEERPDVILNYFKDEKSKLKQNKLAAFNSAYLNSGILIQVPNGVSIAEEIKLFYVQENTDMVHRTVVLADTNSSVKVVEYFINNVVCTANVVTDVFLKENANVNYFSVDRFCEESRVYSALRGNVEKNASFIITRGVLSEANIISDTLINLVGVAANTEIKTVAIAEQGQKQNINTATEHLAKMTSSDITNQGVAVDKAKLVFNNFGKIHNGNSESKAFQSTRGIILNKDASISANPFLLIDEYDVEAGHGATIGKFDDDSLFYLMSRGLSKADAEKLIVNGFIVPILESIENEFLKDQFKHIIDSKLGD